MASQRLKKSQVLKCLSRSHYDEQYFPSQWRFTPCEDPFQEKLEKLKGAEITSEVTFQILNLITLFQISCSKQEFKHLFYGNSWHAVLYVGLMINIHTLEETFLWANVYENLIKRPFGDHQRYAWDHTRPRGLIKRHFSYKSMIRISSRDLRYILLPY